MHVVGNDYMYIAIKSGSGIPARLFGTVFEPDCQRIGSIILIQKIGHIKMERVISVGPLSHFFAIDEYLRIGHCTVKNECNSFTGFVSRKVTGIPIPTHAHKG